MNGNICELNSLVGCLCLDYKGAVRARVHVVAQREAEILKREAEADRRNEDAIDLLLYGPDDEQEEDE